jgi:hypothetical protein
MAPAGEPRASRLRCLNRCYWPLAHMGPYCTAHAWSLSVGGRRGEVGLLRTRGVWCLRERAREPRRAGPVWLIVSCFTHTHTSRMDLLHVRHDGSYVRSLPNLRRPRTLGSPPVGALPAGQVLGAGARPRCWCPCCACLCKRRCGERTTPSSSTRCPVRRSVRSGSGSGSGGLFIRARCALQGPKTLPYHLPLCVHLLPASCSSSYTPARAPTTDHRVRTSSPFTSSCPQTSKAPARGPMRPTYLVASQLI